MAAPTLTGITPPYSPPAAEELVLFDGTGYNVPAIPVPEAQYPGVRVWINGRESTDVRPLDSVRMNVRVPRYLGEASELPATVDVRIANVDATGSIVAGEDVTFPDAFEYRREEARAPESQPFESLAIREVIREFERQVGLPVVFGVHPDYQDEGELVYFEAPVPCIGIRDINLSDYPYHDLYGQVEVQVPGGGEWQHYRDRQEAEFEFSMVLVAGSKDELLRYYHLVRNLERRTKYIYVPRYEGGKGTPDLLRIKFRLDLDGDMGLNYRQVLASMSFTATMGPCPIESPEVIGRSFEALTLVYDLRNSL